MQKFGYKIMKKNLADEAPVVHAAIAQQRPLEVGLYQGDAEIWEFIVATLNEAAQPIPINTHFEVSTLGEAYVDALSGPIATGGESVRVMPGREYRRGPYTVPCRVRVRSVSGEATYGGSTEPVPVMATTGPGGGIGITNILSLTQAQYDAIVTKDAATLYVIVEG